MTTLIPCPVTTCSCPTITFNLLSSFSYKYLVGVGSSSTGLGESSVLLLEDNPHPPSTEHTKEREDSHSSHCQSVPRCVDCSEEVRRVDERGIRDRGHHGDGNSFLLLSLRTDSSGPTKNDTVDTVGTETEDDHGYVSACGVAWW